MNSRERVEFCLTFKKPDRIPRDLWILPYVILFEKDKYDELVKEYPIDFDNIELSSGSNNLSLKNTFKKGSYKDDWGSIWFVAEPGVVGEVKKPVLNRWHNLNKFKPPFNLIKDRKLSYINKYCKKSDKFVLSDLTANVFERLQFLRGTQNLFMDIAYGRNEFYKLLDMVHEFNLEDIKSWIKTDVDGIKLMDDWGTQRSLLINPKVWRKIFKPLYKEYCDLIHSAKKYVFFHSDGNIEDIFEDFVEIGIDAINSQLFVMNIEELGKKYKGKITFWGEIDRQNILPFGNIEEVRNAVERVKNALYSDRGGVIVQCEWGKNNPVQNIKAVFKAWNNHT